MIVLNSTMLINMTSTPSMQQTSRKKIQLFNRVGHLTQFGALSDVMYTKIYIAVYTQHQTSYTDFVFPTEE